MASVQGAVTENSRMKSWLKLTSDPVVINIAHGGVALGVGAGTDLAGVPAVARREQTATKTSPLKPFTGDQTLYGQASLNRGPPPVDPPSSLNTLFMKSATYKYLSILPRHVHWWPSRLNPSGSFCWEVERWIAENDVGRDTEGRSPRGSGDAGSTLTRLGSARKPGGAEPNRGWEPQLMD